MSGIATADAAGDSSVAHLDGVGLNYGKTRALDAITLDLPSGCMVGLIGPDGVGKSSLLALIAGARAIQDGRIHVLGGDMANSRHRRIACPDIAYMPQGLGKNLYPTLSVFENIDFFGRLFGHDKAERHRRITELLRDTGLSPFADRPADKLSGGMKQKLGLCCALIHDPELLILDEPTTGVDPLSRRQFWELIASIRKGRPGMSVIVSTAYMEEAAGFDYLVAMNAGRVLATGTPAELLQQTGADDLAGVHRDEPIEPLGLFHIRGRHDDAEAGPAPADPRDQLPELAARQRIDAGRRLVEDQQVRIVNEGAAQPELLPHPARQFFRGAVGERREPGGGEQLGDARLPFGARLPE